MDLSREFLRAKAPQHTCYLRDISFDLGKALSHPKRETVILDG